MGVLLDGGYEGSARQVVSAVHERHKEGVKEGESGGFAPHSPLTCIFPSIHIKRVPTARHDAWADWPYEAGPHPSRTFASERRRGKGVIPIPPIGLKVLGMVRGRLGAGTPTIPARSTTLSVRRGRASTLTFGFARDTAH